MIWMGGYIRLPSGIGQQNRQRPAGGKRQPTAELEGYAVATQARQSQLIEQKRRSYRAESDAHAADPLSSGYQPLAGDQFFLLSESASVRAKSLRLAGKLERSGPLTEYPEAV